MSEIMNNEWEMITSTVYDKYPAFIIQKMTSWLRGESDNEITLSIILTTSNETIEN